MPESSLDIELIFKNALIFDGTGSPCFRADVAVKGDRIFQVGEALSSRGIRVIDAKGMALAPGFVDIHGHSDYHLLARPQADSKILQGVTTEVGGNCGYCAAPVRGETARERAETYRNLFDLDLKFKSLSEYLDVLESVKPAMNFAPLVGYNTLRSSFMGFSAGAPDKEQMKNILGACEEAFEQGAFGLSAGLAYPPACYSGVDELAACAGIAAKRGGFFACHIRSEGRALIESIREVIEVAERSGARLEISHLKTMGRENWFKLDEAFEIIESARERGVDARADRYPYLAAFTSLASILPDWVFEGTRKEFLERVRDEDTRQRIERETLELHPASDYFKTVVVSEVFAPDMKSMEGISLEQAAQERDKRPVELLLDMLDFDGEGPSAVYHAMSEDNLLRILKKDWVMVGSDSAVRSIEGVLSGGKPHPRAFGTCPRVLAHLVREKQALTMESAVKKMSLDPCEAAGIRDRGRIAEGFYADLVLFDPEEIIDRASYDSPHRYPEGIMMVVVNGEVAAEKGALTGNRPGRVLRRNR